MGQETKFVIICFKMSLLLERDLAHHIRKLELSLLKVLGDLELLEEVVR